MPQISPSTGHTLSFHYTISYLLFITSLILPQEIVRAANIPHSVCFLYPLSIWLCVDVCLFVIYYGRELYLSNSKMEHSENFNGFSFPIKVLKARHGEMTCFLGKTHGKGLLYCRKCFQYLGLLLYTHATVLTPWHMAAFTVLVLKVASSWIWVEKTPGSCWSCFYRELVLRFSLVTSWMLKSLLVCV